MILSSIGIPVSTEQFLRLSEHLRKKRPDLDPVTAVHEAIEAWIASTSAPEPVNPRIANTPTSGFWWKSLYLPSGTKVRMKYKGKAFNADAVEGGLRFNGRVVSPSEMVVSITRTARNAWNDLEVQFAGSDVWQRASSLR